MNSPSSHIPYALISPAHNEEVYVEKTIQSVVNQSLLPVKWVIVDDGSTDATASIVQKYLPTYPWMELVQLPKHKERSFAGKVFAFNAGFERVKDLDYEVVGNLDTDTSFGSDYFEFLLSKFAEDSQLGVAGTIFREEGYSSANDSFEGPNHVAGGCQLFRRECFREIGGYIPNKAGGIDWIAVTTARMMGWKTRSFKEKWFFHYRSLGTAERGHLSSTFSYGEKDYYLGNHPIWELCRVAFRITRKPYFVSGIALALGYISAFLRKTKRPISGELMRFHRNEEMRKLKAIIRAVLKAKRIDGFDLAAASTGEREK
jgi:glycosyltransferase involved in cell wall biosynthesis